MKIRLEPTEVRNYPTVEISCESNDLTIGEVIELLVKPALLAWGFHPNNVDEYFGDGY